eukprot:sb/3473237/
MVRDSLVAAGEAFLLSPTVVPHSDDSKRKFLQTKGLTKDEITTAFAKSRSSKSTKDGPTHCQIMDRCMADEGHLKNKSEPSRPTAPYLMIAGTATVALGTVYYLYKRIPATFSLLAYFQNYIIADYGICLVSGGFAIHSGQDSADTGPPTTSDQ